MVDFLQFIEDTNSADSEEKLFELFQKQLADLGFDRVLYSMMTDHDSIGQKAGHGIMRNYPEDWMRHYTEREYVHIDPVRKHVMLSNHPFVWDQMDKIMPCIQEQKRLLNESREAGLKCGIGLGIHCPDNEIVGLGFASSHGGVDLRPNAVCLVKALANQFHFAYREFKMKKGTPPHTENININLTRKEREVLVWCAQGKSKGVIASILGTSENTIDYHMRSIFRKLQVNDRAVAIVKAIKYRLIDI